MTNTETNLLNNEEHREAMQSDVTNKTKEMLKIHGDEYLRKYEVIEEVMQKLTDNGVHVVL